MKKLGNWLKAESSNKQLHNLDIEVFKSIDPKINKRIYLGYCHQKIL